MKIINFRWVFIFNLIIFFTLSACRIDPTAKELITHVPVEFSLEAVTPFNVHRFELSDQIIASVLGPSAFSEKNLNILANDPSSSNFNDTAVTSFQVRSANGATYYFSLSGNQIQRQSDRISLTIPNMPVGQATLGGIMFLTSGGVVNSASDTPATTGAAFTGVWATAGSGGDVPINIDSSSAATQVIGIPLIDTTAGNGGPHLTRSDVKVVVCYDNGTATTAPSLKYSDVNLSASCNILHTPSPAAVNDIDIKVRFLIAGAYSKWYNTSTSPIDPIHYLTLSLATPTLRMELYCDVTSACPPLATAGEIWTSCPVVSNGNILDSYNYSGGQILHLWFKRC